jgi:hypothetical protein
MDVYRHYIDLGEECRECKMIRAASNGDLYYSTVDACQISAKRNINEFYVEVNGDVDTVHLTAGFTKDEQCIIINDALLNGKAAFDRRATPTTIYTSAFVFRK